ncbi:hypothetical protein [Mycoplasma phocoenae]|uniref:Uncharacterized protein n=1 Tax=Mycoplasma phocoenae TaxID=754517 RepID=A0A858U504_9MOLU|nr:hypothetical protein [Mycoplasma phocoenae]QJG67149.1 hypothetical protein HGG69_02400 [Mycoplasma phocoenae]
MKQIKLNNKRIRLNKSMLKGFQTFSTYFLIIVLPMIILMSLKITADKHYLKDGIFLSFWFISSISVLVSTCIYDYLHYKKGTTTLKVLVWLSIILYLMVIILFTLLYSIN